MRIAVNARSLDNTSRGAGYYTLHLFEALAKQHPEHNFIFLSDVPLDYKKIPSSLIVVTGTPVKGLFSLNRWLNGKVKRELKKLKADVFISLDGTGSASASIPQIIGLTDLNFLQQGSFFTRALRNNNFKKNIIKANSIITVSEDLQQQLTLKFPEAQGKAIIIPKAPTEIFQPLNWQQREAIKATYADGKEYFLFTGGFDPSKNLMNVLKAFSQFKKWQQSEMKLIITGNTSDDATGMKQKLETFKFREDVVILNKIDLQKLAALLAAGYALVYPSLSENYGMPVLESLRSGTPAIMSKTSAVGELVGDAVLYADSNDPETISAQMIKLYKDEDLRNKLIEEGLKKAAMINWETSADMLWRVIEKTVQ